MYISDVIPSHPLLHWFPTQNTAVDNAEIQSVWPRLQPAHGHYVCLPDGLHPLQYQITPHATHRHPSLTGIDYDQGVFSGIAGNEDFLDMVNYPSAGIPGIIVSIYNLGCFTGTTVSCAFSDKLGPRLSMWIAMLWAIVCLHCPSVLYRVVLISAGRRNPPHNLFLAHPTPRRTLCHWHWHRYQNNQHTCVPV